MELILKSSSILLLLLYIVNSDSNPVSISSYSHRQPIDATLEQTGRGRGRGSDYDWSTQGRTPSRKRVEPKKEEQKKPEGFFHLFFSFLGLSKVLAKLQDSMFGALTCDSCKLAAGVLHYFRSTNRSIDSVIRAVTDICVTFKVQSPRVCKGIVPSFRDEAAYLLENIVLDPNEVCGVIVGPHCSHVFNPLQNWTIHIPPKLNRRETPSVPQKGSPVLRVLHLSDTHYDPYYQEGANAECGEPLCCRDDISNDIPVEKRAGRWGDYRNCDTPKRTLENMLDHITKTHKIDYVLWTGDLPPHDVWNQTRSTQIFHLYKMTEMMLRYFPDVPIFPALGNHESSPVDSFPPPYIQGENSIDWLYSQLNNTWSHWLGDNIAVTVNKGAYYSVLLYPGFRIISINSNYCNNKNWWLLLNTTDSAQELQWLVFQLQTSEQKGEKVHIIGHIPPGSTDCISVWSRNYNNIINRYKDTIMGQFFGHTHVDEFQVFYEKLRNGKRIATNVAYIGPSTTPFQNLNPGYRIYTVDGIHNQTTWKVLDHETYYMNLTAANIYNSPVWIKEYSAKEAYSMKSFEPSEWDKLIQRFKWNQELFHKYYRYYSRMSDSFSECDEQCRWNKICDLQKAISHDNSFC